MMIRRLICWWNGGHARMKRVPMSMLVNSNVRVFECPRCGYIESRKIYPRTKKEA